MHLEKLKQLIIWDGGSIQNHAQMLGAETVLTVAAPKIVEKLQLIIGHERANENPVYLLPCLRKQICCK